MEGPPRSSHKDLLLQVWCALLTVALVTMATVLTSIRLKPVENIVSSALKKRNVTLPGTSPSYIELIKGLEDHSWKYLVNCEACSLTLHNNSIYSNRTSSELSLYFIYAQVSFQMQESQRRSVMLIRNASPGKAEKKLVEAPGEPGRSVWVAKMVRLKKGESVRLMISGAYNGEDTFWGAFQLY
ncbi:lymphotoxin-alpha [Nothobranchius furzeri]|uniref:lymphotoxin-alpha n=1 Tax=Nothobranchius furzeri TaxID=105023 RepID=UPI003904DC96